MDVVRRLHAPRVQSEHGLSDRGDTLVDVELREVEEHVRASWGADTCDPVDLPWSPANPSRGQCGVTALVLHDLLGGALLVAEVRFATGGRQGFHTWNQLPDGTQVDLTREQFRPDELVGVPRVVERPPGLVLHRCVEQYAVLSDRVGQAVARSRSSPSTGSTRGTSA